MGNDRYPTSLNSATSLLQKWAENNPSSLPFRPPNRRDDRVQFTQGGGNRIGREDRKHGKNKSVKGTDGVFHAGIKYYRCGAEGHYAPECPDVSTTNLQHIILSQSKEVFALLKTWIIIDTGSTLNSFCNRRLLSGLRRCNGIRAISNGGDIEYNHKGPTTIFPAINAYFNASSLANTLSFLDVRKYYHIQYDYKNEDSFLLHLDGSQVLHFKSISRGLYYIDTNINTFIKTTKLSRIILDVIILSHVVERHDIR